MIRDAAKDDAEDIACLWNWMIRETLATFTTEEKPVKDVADLLMHREGAFFVAEVEGAVQGFCTFGPFRDGPGYAHTVEHTVILDPRAHRSGLGTALMKAAEMAAQKQGRHAMIGAISGANQSAIGFHRTLGFVEVGHLPEVGYKNEQWLDLILMQKNLSRAI